MRADRHRRKSKKILWITLSIIFLLIASALSYGFYLYQKAANAVENSYEHVQRGTGRDESKSLLREEEVDPAIDNVSILIIGIDDNDERNYGKRSRSDTLILATFNKEANSVKLLSIPRDTYTYVADVDRYTKINHAHAYGGPSSTIETVENFLDVPVDYFVRFNFKAFIEVVDSLGGIMFDVPYEIYEIDSRENENAIHLLPGEQRLNGEEALAIARTRKYDSDIQRGKRQIEVIQAIVTKAASASSILKLDNVIDAVGNNMATNLTFDQIKSFASYGVQKSLEMETLTLEGSGGISPHDKLWYYNVHEESKNRATRELREHLGLR